MQLLSGPQVGLIQTVGDLCRQGDTGQVVQMLNESAPSLPAYARKAVMELVHSRPEFYPMPSWTHLSQLHGPRVRTSCMPTDAYTVMLIDMHIILCGHVCHDRCLTPIQIMPSCPPPTAPNISFPPSPGLLSPVAVTVITKSVIVRPVCIGDFCLVAVYAKASPEVPSASAESGTSAQARSYQQRHCLTATALLHQPHIESLS